MQHPVTKIPETFKEVQQIMKPDLGDKGSHKEQMNATGPMESTPRSLHTPGPWQVAYWIGVINDTAHEALAVWPADIVEPFRGDPICLVSNVKTQDATDEANANLIAAAPELLKDAYSFDQACRAVIRTVNSGDLHAISQAANFLRLVAEGSRKTIAEAEGAPSVQEPNDNQ